MCEKIDTSKEVIRQENGRKVIVKNPKSWEIGVVQVDDCLITDTKRCDWLFRLPENKKLKNGVCSAKLVELKGSDVQKAFSQLDATLVHPAIAGDKSTINECFIVSKISPLLTGTIQIEKKKFYQIHSIPVHVVPLASIDAVSG